MNRQKFENLAILVGFPVLWMGIGGILMAKTHTIIGLIFIGGAVCMSVVVGWEYKKKRLAFMELSTKDRIVFTIGAVASVGFGMAAPHILALFSR